MVKLLDERIILFRNSCTIISSLGLIKEDRNGESNKYVTKNIENKCLLLENKESENKESENKESENKESENKESENKESENKKNLGSFIFVNRF